MCEAALNEVHSNKLTHKCRLVTKSSGTLVAHEGALVDGGEHVFQIDGPAQRKAVRYGGAAFVAVGHVDCEQKAASRE